ncbi:LPXTG cell wall anchor domain-containing protein [Rubrobacter tropicus]|uniref:LPXTG cell wall anchor domain-containing protein n=1 Tax=Rubrobacter tropicus TaxID=2653851 RepID=A0A6G8QDR0_9ACTN|nr:LPXTG cell wall anchor domain-containing protein [Rubrobacter tropicus]QIN84387.1 LPXTG cell wall anchor domain-containing protein [Rubrobacter tropicus]
MVENTRFARLKAVHLAGLFLASTLLLLWSTAAYAQSREGQYGSPTDTVDHASRVSGTLSVLPDTGGPLILFVGAALIVTGTGIALVRRRAGYR